MQIRGGEKQKLVNLKSDAATGGVLRKNVFLKISQNSQESICGTASVQERLF